MKPSEYIDRVLNESDDIKTGDIKWYRVRLTDMGQFKRKYWLGFFNGVIYQSHDDIDPDLAYSKIDKYDFKITKKNVRDYVEKKHGKDQVIDVW
jgi:hypothetical protein